MLSRRNRKTHFGPFFPSNALVEVSFITAPEDTLRVSEAAGAEFGVLERGANTVVLSFGPLILSFEPC